MLIELHILQNHAPSNLNRDDTGSPKSAVFGGVPRARISSQCIKRSIRRSAEFRAALDGHLANRTRRLPEEVRRRLEERGYTTELADLAARKASGFGNKEGKEQTSKNDRYSTAQTMLLAEADIEAVVTSMAGAIDKAKRDVKKFEKIKTADLQEDDTLGAQRTVTVDSALFGRMITSDAFRDIDACMQVAHAISTHKVAQEYDYFTAVDDLKNASDDDDAGADMIGDVEFNSACYYKYFSLNVDGLLDNLTGAAPYGRNASDDDRARARDLAARTVEAFVRAAALVTPTGKQNSFAAHQPPSLMLAEVRTARTPISYANAFVKPVAPNGMSDLVGNSISRLAQHATRLTEAFNLETSRRLVLDPENGFEAAGVEKVKDLNTFARHLRDMVAHA